MTDHQFQVLLRHPSGHHRHSGGPPTSKGLNLGPLGNLNQVVKALSKTIRAMADGSIATRESATGWAS
jgi:hypothetical protein